MVAQLFRRSSLIALGLLASGCAHHHAARNPTSPASSPAPISRLAAVTSSSQINKGLGAEEALWHVRAALNVAALLCGRQAGGTSLVQRYNAFLIGNKAPLAQAYASETQRFASGNPAALDRHMTQLYNFFARPEATPAFCAASTDVAQQASSTPGAELASFAPSALARLDTAIVSPSIAPAARRHAEVEAGTQSTATTGEWRIQLGAFASRANAVAAWTRIRARLPALARYKAIFEPLPDRPLMRLQIGSARDRNGALQLCATAAAGGFDCMPVAGKTR